MKKGLILLDEALQSQGLQPGVHYEFVLNVHDEWQIECDEAIAPVVAAQAVNAIREAGVFYNFRCPLDGEARIGKTWADTH